jgi:hypothetical protein
MAVSHIHSDIAKLMAGSDKIIKENASSPQNKRRK